jgi:hypothetical protein
MTTPSKRFKLLPGSVSSSASNQVLGAYGLMIEDFIWWMDNERNILNWMVDNMPQGIDHQQGMFIYFPTDRERIGFLLRWT